MGEAMSDPDLLPPAIDLAGANLRPPGASVTTAPGARLSVTIARFCSALHRRRRSGPVMTSNLAIAPSLAPVQTPLLAPVLTNPTRLRNARRPSPDGYLTYAREGDLIVVWKLDRLSRSLGHLVEIVQELQCRGIGFRSLTEAIDTSSPSGKAIFPIFAAISSVERTLIQERTRAGLAAARQRGRVGGRPKVLTAEKLEAATKLLANGTAPRDVASALGVSIPTLYRHCPASRRTVYPQGNSFLAAL